MLSVGLSSTRLGSRMGIEMNRNACPPTASWPRLSRRLLAALAGVDHDGLMRRRPCWAARSAVGLRSAVAGEEPPKPQTSPNRREGGPVMHCRSPAGGAAASGLKNGAELAVAQFENANVQLL